MNNQRVQTLEALLTRIKKNAGEPRPERASPRVEAPVGAETRGAAAAKPVAETRTAPPPAAAPKEPQASPRAAAAPIATPPEPKRAAPTAETVPSHTGTPKVTPRLIDPVTSADQDPAKWTLDDMGTGEPSPKPVAVQAPSKTPPAKAPVDVKRADPIPEAKPSPKAGLGGLAGFGKQIEAKRQEPKAEPAKVQPAKVEPAKVEPTKHAEPAKQAAAFRQSDLDIDIDEPTHAEPPKIPSLGATPDEEVEATVSGPIPTHILEMSRAATNQGAPPARPAAEPKPAPPPAEPVLELPPPPAVEMQPMGAMGIAVDPVEPTAENLGKKGLGHTVPMALDTLDDVVPSPNVTPPMDPPVVDVARSPDPEPEPKPQPRIESKQDLKPEPTPEPAVAPIEAAPVEKSLPKAVDPAFSSGESKDFAPSKFASDPVDTRRSGGGAFGKRLIFVVVAVAVAVGIFVYLRRDQFFGSGKPEDSGAPTPSQSTPAPALSPTAPASTTTPASTPSGSVEPATSAAPPTSATAASDVGEPPGDPKQLGPTQGYIYVKTTHEGDVYAGNAKIGPVNKWIITPCPAFISVGKAIGQFVAPGKTAPVPCQGKLVYELP